MYNDMWMSMLTIRMGFYADVQLSLSRLREAIRRAFDNGQTESGALPGLRRKGRTGMDGKMQFSPPDGENRLRAGMRLRRYVSERGRMRKTLIQLSNT